MKVKVVAKMDRNGFLHVDLVSKAHKKKIIDYLINEWSIRISWRDSVVFIQSEYEIESFYENFFLNKLQKKDIESGWSVTFLVDPWEFLNYVGWGAHENVKL
ncbi:MAG: hypothetical protein ACO30N_07565 [Schleiferiaceae bacterium]